MNALQRATNCFLPAFGDILQRWWLYLQSPWRGWSVSSITQIVVRGFTATSNIDEREIEAAALASTQDKDAISSKLTELEEALSSKTEKLAAAVATAALLESTASTATSRIASNEAEREAAGLAYSEGKDILNS